MKMKKKTLDIYQLLNNFVPWFCLNNLWILINDSICILPGFLWVDNICYFPRIIKGRSNHLVRYTKNEKNSQKHHN